MPLGSPVVPEAGGDEVEQIVEAGAGPAEREVTLGLVADHRVGGVDGLVEGDAGQAEQDQPEQRGDDRVGGRLG